MKKFKVALQLYSIREDMEKDMDAALKKVKEIGYDYVEFASFYGRSAEEVRSLLDKHELTCISVHQGPLAILEEGQKAIGFLKTIGVKYCAIPSWPAEKMKGSDAWENTVEDFTKVGRALKQNGIQLLYHNHDYEFKKYEGKFLLDWIFEAIPADILQPQIDTCWVHYAGYDPDSYIMKYVDRISVVHLKDFICKNLSEVILADGKQERTGSREENGFEFRPVGYGIQDFSKILEASETAGADYVVVEQDMSPDREPMEAARLSREYLMSLGL